jgi:hypothetical protein
LKPSFATKRRLRERRAEMGIFNEALKEVKSSLLKVSLFEETLNTIIVFLVVYFIGSFFKFGLILGLVAAGCYFVYALYKERRIRPNYAVETKYRDLKEKLSTAAEYASVDNRVVNELKAEVLKNLKKVEESSFIDEKKIYIKSVVAVGLCFIILLSSPISIGLFKATFPNLFADKQGSDSNTVSGNFKATAQKDQNDLNMAINEQKSDIYGAPTIAKLGSEELKVVLKPAGSELSSQKVKPPEELQFQEQFPEEVVSVASESMEERIPQEQQELVRNYFKDVVKGSQ